MHKFSRIGVSLATVGMVGSMAFGAVPAQAATTSYWQQLEAATGTPPSLAGASMVYDGSHEILTGGYDGKSVLGTWEWDGSKWTKVSSGPPSPSGDNLGRSYAQVAYDSGDKNVILFGGQGGTNNASFYNDMYRWSAATSTWTPVTNQGGTVPTPRAFAAFAYDPDSQQTVLFGGQKALPGQGTPDGETYVWNDSTSTWSHPTPAGPSARYGASMVYDPAIHRLVLFGGIDGTGQPLQDTWTWDAIQEVWNPVTTATTLPPARYGAGMAYDPAIGEVVLYGGEGASGSLPDTWAFNGTNWTQLSSSSPPGPRFAPAMDYDSGTRQTLLYGGASNSSIDGDTWAYQTVQQQLPPPATAPGAPSGLTAGGGNGQATLAWTAPSSDGGSAVTGYNVYEGTVAGGESATPVNSTPVSGTTYTVKGLTNGSTYYFTVRAVNGVGTSPASNEARATPVAPAPIVQGGYNLVASDGGVFSFGDAGFYGSAGNIALNQPVVGMARTPDHAGYWLVARDGGIFSYGDATFEGSAGGTHLNQPIVGMAATPDGHGYWLVARDGGIFTYGDASYYGSTGGVHLASPVVGMAATPDGHGYWEVLADGQVYSFGNAGRFGSVSGSLNHPIVGMAATPDGRGYWLVASDGGVFSFGAAAFDGSAGAIALNQPIVGMAATADGHGYWLVARDGGIFSYGDAGFHGSTGGTHLNAPVVGMGA